MTARISWNWALQATMKKAHQEPGINYICKWENAHQWQREYRGTERCEQAPPERPRQLRPGTPPWWSGWWQRCAGRPPPLPRRCQRRSPEQYMSLIRKLKVLCSTLQHRSPEQHKFLIRKCKVLSSNNPNQSEQHMFLISKLKVLSSNNADHLSNTHSFYTVPYISSRL